MSDTPKHHELGIDHIPGGTISMTTDRGWKIEDAATPLTQEEINLFGDAIASHYQ